MSDLFTSDLARNFGLGFAAGALVLALANGATWLSAVPQMVASLL